jgi:hypothetical protein
MEGEIEVLVKDDTLAKKQKEKEKEEKNKKTETNGKNC